MPETYDILIVDDEVENWLPVLEPVAETYDCKLLSAESVEESLELLEQYDAVIDAIILDLSFPKGRLQGKEGLQRMRAQYPHRPVLILTSSGSAEDIRTAVECVRLGAYDYLPKGTLDPQHLFLQVEQAIEQERQEQRHLVLTETAAPELEEPYFEAVEVCVKDGPSRHVRHFALILSSLAKTRNDEEQQDAVQAAREWHRNLLGFLSLSHPATRFRLRYLAAPEALDAEEPQLYTGLIATVEAANPEEATARASLLYRELMVYLMGSVRTGAKVYSFTPVVSKEQMRAWLIPVHEREGLRISRSMSSLRAAPGKPGIGFTSATSGSTEIQLPGSTGEGAMERTLGHVCRLMMEQPVPTLLDISLRPSKLSTEESDILRGVAQGKVGTTGLSLKENEALIAFSEELLRQAGCCFEVDLYLAQDQDRVSNSLLAAAISDFFKTGSSSATEQICLDVMDGMLCPLPSAAAAKARFSRLYSVESARQLFRLPLPTSDGIPGIQPTHPVFKFIPSDLSAHGPLLGGKLVGTRPELVHIDPADMLRHVYILGQTGTGKTTMLGSMMRERLEAGAGIGLIDPHGDLCDTMLRFIPEARRDDVILFDPTDEDSPIRLNLLEYDPRYPRLKTKLINDLFSIFEQEYDMKTAGGPMFETYMRNALLLVMDDPREPGTLLDVVKVFQDDGFRLLLLSECKNPLVVNFWTQEAEKAGGEAQLQNIAPYITSKLNRFLFDEYLCSLIDQRRSTINFRSVMDEGKILLIKLSKGRLGDVGMKMFGTVVFSRLLMAALSRGDVPEKERRDFFLFVDEFQNFTTRSIAEMLSEARKYHLSLTLANQTLYQLDKTIVDAVLGNVGSLIFLRPGVQDYERIEPYVKPFRRGDIVNMPNFVAVARLLVRNSPTRPFVFQTLPLLDNWDGAVNKQ